MVKQYSLQLYMCSVAFINIHIWLLHVEGITVTAQDIIYCISHLDWFPEGNANAKSRKREVFKRRKIIDLLVKIIDPKSWSSIQAPDDSNISNDVLMTRESLPI